MRASGGSHSPGRRPAGGQRQGGRDPARFAGQQGGGAARVLVDPAARQDGVAGGVGPGRRVDLGQEGAHRAAVDLVVLQRQVEPGQRAVPEHVQRGQAGELAQQRVEHPVLPLLDRHGGRHAGHHGGQRPLRVAELVDQAVQVGGGQQPGCDGERHGALGGVEQRQQAADQFGDGHPAGRDGGGPGGEVLGLDPQPGRAVGGVGGQGEGQLVGTGLHGGRAQSAAAVAGSGGAAGQWAVVAVQQDPVAEP
ncbi:hypothetical protein HUT16_24420 [Kitasatospora sp. NA04385]|uniref:hypothetical protein n=1 Tax=Kitasatospora sp. NA04385 TaxID=2742135 RepID=UPI00158FB23D|nr:hypothetical protein [Kitasatospora sp. NA04385]QKW21783.1 hypothetical protein HUT16_24420 [Kitasatospora sp. NA04385]